MAEEWYRMTTWTPEDQAAFFARLKRSRGNFHKAQYARIQACSLLGTGQPEACQAALELLEMILSEWHEDAQLAMVHHHRADCFVVLSDLPNAIAAFRQVFEVGRVRKGEQTAAHLDFGWLIATTPLPELYHEALAVLHEFGDGFFPVERYRASVIRSFILGALGDAGPSRDNARSALELAAIEHSGFSHRPKLGLVGPMEPEIRNRLRAIAGDPPW